TERERDGREAFARRTHELVVPRAHADRDPLPEDRGQHEALVVVGVLTDEIDAAGRFAPPHGYILRVADFRRGMLALAERLPPDPLASLREWWWKRRMDVYVTPGEELVQRRPEGLPDDVRGLAGAF